MWGNLLRFPTSLRALSRQLTLKTSEVSNHFRLHSSATYAKCPVDMRENRKKIFSHVAGEFLPKSGKNMAKTSTTPATAHRKLYQRYRK